MTNIVNNFLNVVADKRTAPTNEQVLLHLTYPANWPSSATRLALPSIVEALDKVTRLTWGKYIFVVTTDDIKITNLSNPSEVISEQLELQF